MANKKKSPKVSIVDSPNPSGASIGRVVDYDFFTPGRRVNHAVEGFWFDQDTFENLIDSWADLDDIPLILQSSPQDLDVFCYALYNDNFPHTYSRLRAISKVIARKELDKLAKSGNSAAIAATKQHFPLLIDALEPNNNININIKNDLDS